MNVIIFGINGQDGYYLNKLCKAEGLNVIGVSRSGGEWITGDVSNYEQTGALIKKYRPDYIFHLAANSTTRHEALFENYQTIVTGTLNILETVKKHSPTTKVFVTGSGLQFVNKELPISESDSFEANSAYSMARIQSVYAARYYRSLGIHVYIGYLFHHESPFRKSNHVSKMIALGVQKIASGNIETIELGDISVRKEWAFAGDIARAMLMLVKQDAVFEATIGSGQAYSIQDWLEVCFKLIGKDWREYTCLREGFKPEYKQLLSNPKTINALGWYPNVTLSDLAKLMIHSEHAFE